MNTKPASTNLCVRCLAQTPARKSSALRVAWPSADDNNLQYDSPPPSHAASNMPGRYKPVTRQRRMGWKLSRTAAKNLRSNCGPTGPRWVRSKGALIAAPPMPLRLLEVRGGIEPPYADLQSAASPLCHRTGECNHAVYRAGDPLGSSPVQVATSYSAEMSLPV
jgi:hypothetical protein